MCIRDSYYTINIIKHCTSHINIVTFTFNNLHLNNWYQNFITLLSSILYSTFIICQYNTQRPITARNWKHQVLLSKKKLIGCIGIVRIRSYLQKWSTQSKCIAYQIIHFFFVAMCSSAYTFSVSYTHLDVYKRQLYYLSIY